VRVGPGNYQQTGSPSDAGLGMRVNGEYFISSGGSFAATSFNHRTFGGAAKCTLIVQELP
jgi:hypothetical protein